MKSSGTTEHLYGGVWGTSGSNVCAVGDNGTILHFAPPSPYALPVGLSGSMCRV